MRCFGETEREREKRIEKDRERGREAHTERKTARQKNRQRENMFCMFVYSEFVLNLYTSVTFGAIPVLLYNGTIAELMF